jgi:CheY-like chemotaxis protein
MPAFELERFITTTLARYQAAALQKGIELHAADDLASYVTLTGNSTQVGQLLETVLQHTIDHSGASRIDFSTQQLLRSDKEILLEFVIRNNCTETSGHTRVRFFRALLNAQSMVEAMDGKSEISTNAGGDTTFRFILRFPWMENPCNCKTAAPSCASVLHDKKVLIVEDNEINQRTISAILRTEGIAYAVAANGREAIDLLEQQGGFHLVLLDLHMPHMDGFETANYIRKHIDPLLPIIGMTIGNNNDSAHCLEVGMNQFIKKPFAADELIRQLCSFFDPVVCVLDEPRLKTA